MAKSDNKTQFCPSTFSSLQTGISHRQYTEQQALSKITHANLLTPQQSNQGKTILWLLANAAALGNSQPFLQIYNKFHAHLTVEVLTAKVGNPQESIISLLDKAVYEAKGDMVAKLVPIKIFLDKFSHFEAAKIYFSMHPAENKYKKIAKYTGHSFVKVNNQIFQVANRFDPNDKVLGAGGFGNVKVAKNHQNEKFKLKIEGGDKSEYSEESITIGQRLGNTIGYMKRQLVKLKKFKNMLIKSKTYTLMNISLEHGKNLREILHQQILSDNQKLIIAIKVILELKKLHDTYHIIHADLKPENILLFIDNNNPHKIELEIIDFDCAVLLPVSCHETKRNFCNGTLGYRAPEVSQGMYSFKSDIYSLGYMFETDLGLHLIVNIHDMLSQQSMHRPSLLNINQRLLSQLSKQSNLDNETINFIHNSTAISRSTVPIFFHLLPPIVKKITEPSFSPLVSRTQRSWLHDPCEGKQFLGKDWLRVTSKIDFVHNPNKLWVSLGSSHLRENIFFDINSPLMLKLKLSIFNACQNKSIFETLRIVSASIFNLNRNNQNSNIDIEKELDNYLSTLPKNQGKIQVTLDTLIEKGLLVCRHRALIAAAALSFLVENQILPKGKVRCYRSEICIDDISDGVHSWALYRDCTNAKLWLCDPHWNKTIDLYQMFHHPKCYLPENKAIANDSRYGFQTLVEMIRRVDEIDILKQFSEELNSFRSQLPIIGTCRLSDDSYLHFAKRVIIELNSHRTVYSFSSLQYALKRQKIEFSHCNLSNNDILQIYVNDNAKIFSFDITKLLRDYSNRFAYLNSQSKRIDFTKAAQEGRIQELHAILTNDTQHEIGTRTIGVAALKAAEQGYLNIVQFLFPKCGKVAAAKAKAIMDQHQAIQVLRPTK